MQVFTTPEGKFKDIADKYKKSGEKIRITLPIEFEGKKYREIAYNKTLFGKTKRNIEGLIFVTEDGEYISDERLKRELSALGYHLEVMLDDKSLNELKNAVINDLDIEKQIIDYEHVIKAIERMNNSNILGIDTVISILNKLPNHKRENNKAIEAYIKQVELIRPEEFVFNTSIYNELYSYYREILIKNFQRVRLVVSGKRFYDDIKREGQKRKRSLSARFNTHDVYMGLTKLPVELDHLKSIVTVYESVSDMKQEEYLKYLKSVEKTNINGRLQLVR